MDQSFALASCPRCQKQVANQRLQQDVVVCNHCGFISETREEANAVRIEKKAVKTMAGISMLFVAAFIHIANWGSNSVVIVPLKMQEMLGLASVENLEEIAQICTEQAKPFCVEKALAGIAAKDPQNIENLAKLANFEARLNKLTEAERNYSSYFAKGGIRPEAAYDYAVVLEKLNRVTDAIRMYDFALINKPDVLQITVTQSYARLLMNNSRYKEARTLIDSIRRKGDNAKYFMAAEYEEIAKNIR